jgi:hypothetical protein
MLSLGAFQRTKEPITKAIPPIIKPCQYVIDRCPRMQVSWRHPDYLVECPQRVERGHQHNPLVTPASPATIVMDGGQ